MDLTGGIKPRPRPGHTEGTTRCAYTTDGSRLVSVGSNNTIRLYKTGFDGEPDNIDECPEQNVAVATSSAFFVAGSEDGTVSLYSLATASFERFLMRCSLPIRDLALSPDGKWCAVASDELTVKIVNTEDNLQVRTLKEHGRPTKHLSFDPKGTLLALSCTDGIVYVYSMTSDTPELIRKVDGVIGALDSDADTTAAPVWHPDGRSFAMATPTRDIQVISKNDWEKQRKFTDGHLGDITAVAWSPNGAMLASASRDGKLLIWETKSQSVIARHHYNDVIDIAWHPTKNIISFTTSGGQVYIYTDFMSDQFTSLLRLPIQPSPFFHDPLAEANENARRPDVSSKQVPVRPRRDSLGSLEDAMLGDDLDDYGLDGDLDDFVVDDDGAGYTSGSRKRPADGEIQGEHASKRRQLLQPLIHTAFQPGSTPWRGNRKYLCLNLIGAVWTVDQDSHHTVTVEFYDREFQRDFHFTDTFLYDKACLNEKGTLFSCPPKDDDQPSIVFYRPHESWTHRSDWRTELPKGESVVAMSLSDSFVTVVTSANYVRVYTLFGIPYRVYRPKSTPAVTCASWKDYVLIMGNGPVGSDGRTRLLYSIENIKLDEMCQNEDTVALPEGATVTSVFFSDKGDPCIYDSTGTLLTLLHWRRPSRASWVPLLDTKLMSRLASGRKTESYYPIAVADDKFHCIILKGGDQYPYFPRPLLSEFDFAVPLTSSAKPKTKRRAADGGGNSDAEVVEEEEEDEDDDQAQALLLSQQFLVTNILAAQVRDAADDPGGRRSHAERVLLGRLELEADKTLLKMLAVECRLGEERGMRALEMVELMRDATGRMVEAAGKVADRYDRGILAEKIRELGGRRMDGMDGMDEDED